MFKKANMEYRRFGNSGLLLSVLSYGNFESHAAASYEQHVNLLKTCLTNGINFFDTAEYYSEGKDQEFLGRALKEINEPRERLVISTKVWVAPNAQINSQKSTNRKHIKQSVKGSLKRLQLEYVDIIFAHSYDENTPIEQICRSFHQVIEQGLAFYWGTSNWDADKVFQAFQVCEKYNLHKPIGAQNQYNMAKRNEIQTEYRTLFQKYGYGLIGFSPLLSGYLTGKYLDNKQALGRFTTTKQGFLPKEAAKNVWLHGVDTEKLDGVLRQLKQIAEKQLECDLATLALAWVLKFKHVSTALFGARTADHVERMFKSIEVYKKLTNEIEGRINKILDNNPTPRMDFKTFSPGAPVRPVSQ